MPTHSEYAALAKQIKELKSILAKILGSDQTSVEEAFSKDSLNKAAKEFKRLQRESNAWISEKGIRRYVKTLSPYDDTPGNILREQFSFTGFIKNGRQYRYLKKNLIAFEKERKKRNIHLMDYERMVFEKKNFEKNIDKIKTERDPFYFPDGIKDVVTGKPPYPDPMLIQQDFAMLEKEFIENQFENYIAMYDFGFAHMKDISGLSRYYPNGLERRCRKWCDNFNYAVSAYERVTGKTHRFNPPPSIKTYL